MNWKNVNPGVSIARMLLCALLALTCLATTHPAQAQSPSIVFNNWDVRYDVTTLSYKDAIDYSFTANWTASSSVYLASEVYMVATYHDTVTDVTRTGEVHIQLAAYQFWDSPTTFGESLVIDGDYWAATGAHRNEEVVSYHYRLDVGLSDGSLYNSITSSEHTY
jgi:hypothetical protein